MLNLHIPIDEDNKVLNILRIIQLCDSNFPIGSFNHSYGMETYLRKDKVIDSNTMRKFIKVFLNNVFIYSDGLAIRMLYQYLNEDNLEKVWKLDRMLTAQTIATETRNGSKLVANRMIKLFQDLYNTNLIDIYEKKIIDKVVSGHPAIVFGMLMYTLNYSEEEAINFHMYSTVSTLIQNGVRAIPLGQKDGMMILKESCEMFDKLYEKINSMDEECFGGSSPGIELSQINHETLEFRLFMS